jgi:hypothetical protein
MKMDNDRKGVQIQWWLAASEDVQSGPAAVRRTSMYREERYACPWERRKGKCSCDRAIVERMLSAQFERRKER